jgi:hypothetical protein
MRAEVPLEMDNPGVHGGQLPLCLTRIGARSVYGAHELMGLQGQFAESRPELGRVKFSAPLVTPGRLSKGRLCLIHDYRALLAGFYPIPL